MSPSDITIIQNIIDDLFNKTKLRVLGPNYVAKSFIFSLNDFDPAKTATSLYLHAASQHSVGKDSIDVNTIKKINDTLNTFLDTIKDKVSKNAAETVRSFLHEADVKSRLSGMTIDRFLKTDAGMDIKQNAMTAVSEVIDKSNNDVKRLIVNELHNAQSLGALDGIVGMSKSLGIDDPVVFKIGNVSPTLCKVCRKLWHLESNIQIPKLYKLSELRGGYEDMKNPSGTLGPTHPNCAHFITTMLPNFGFDDGGKIVYVGPGHDEYKKQRG